MCIMYTNKERVKDMYYKIVKNKIRFYEVEVDKKLEKREAETLTTLDNF